MKTEVADQVLIKTIPYKFSRNKYLANMQTEWRTNFHRRSAEMWTPLKRLLWSVQRPGTVTLLKMWNEIARLNVSVRNAQSNSIKMNTDGGGREAIINSM